jgi:hypothetical protein
VRALKRVLSIIVALALVGAGVALGWAERAYPPPAPAAVSLEAVAVPPGDSVAVCPGALRLPTEGEGEPVYDPRFDPAATLVDSIGRVVAEGGQGGRSVPLGDAVATGLLAPLAVATETVGEAAVRIEAFSAESAPALATGATFQHIGDGDLRGVAASPCIPAASEAWLVAGSTEPGSSGRVLLTNAGFTNVTADIEVWDGSGLVDAIGLTGLVVPPSSQRAVLLEGFVGDAARLALRVTASGGELAVFLQHSRLQGMTAGGVEIATPGLAPANQLVVPGLDVTDSTFDSLRASALRVLNPGESEAVLSVELWGPDGPTTLPGLEEAAVGPGLVTDLSLAGLPAGRYAAVVTSDQPVVVAGLSLRSGEGEAPEEFAWSASTAPQASGFAALPGQDLTARLVVASQEASTLVITPLGTNGELGQPFSLAVPARTAVALEPAEVGSAADAAALRFAWEGATGYVALVVSAEDSAGSMVSAVVPRGHRSAATEVLVYPQVP